MGRKLMDINSAVAPAARQLEFNHVPPSTKPTPSLMSYESSRNPFPSQLRIQIHQLIPRQRTD